MLHARNPLREFILVREAEEGGRPLVSDIEGEA
jgi:hypothetical protein